MVATYIGEALLFLFSLPLFAYQTLEGIHALAEVFSLVSQYMNWK